MVTHWRTSDCENQFRFFLSSGGGYIWAAAAISFCTSEEPLCNHRLLTSDEMFSTKVAQKAEKDSREKEKHNKGNRRLKRKERVKAMNLSASVFTTTATPAE